MSDAQVAEWTKEFTHIDKDGDGSISSDEVKQTWTEDGKKFTPADVDVWFKAIDTDGDGKISKDEYLAYKKSQ